MLKNQSSIQDSLQNFQPKHKSISPSGRDDKQRALFQQKKQKFIISLSKLQLSQTRQIGLQQIRQIIDRNRQQQYIRMYIGSMKSLKKQGTSSSTKQHQILIFSIMAQILKQNLIDPIDKPNPNRIKTCFRIIQILHSYFTDTSGTVQQACARVIIDLGKYTLGAQQQSPSLNIQTYITLLFTPLASILKNGVDKASQSTAAVCINEQIQYWKSHSQIRVYKNMIQQICTQMLNVALKLNCQYNQIFMALSTLIQIKGIQFFNGRIVQFVNKILGVINKINNSNSNNNNNTSNLKSMPDNINNFNSYMCKVYVCEILQKIGDMIRDKPDIKTKLNQLDVIPALQRTTRNRVIQVQIAAAKAIKVWNGQILSPEPKDNNYNRRPMSSKPGSNRNIMSLEQARKNKKKLRSNSKQEKLKLQRQLNHIKQDLNKLVKGGWGPHTRANNFIKKNTGVGGGYCSKMDDSPSPGKGNKSHKQHIEELRQFIKQSSKQHGNKDKFVFYQERDKSPAKKQKARSQQNFYINQDRQRQRQKSNQKQRQGQQRRQSNNRQDIKSVTGTGFNKNNKHRQQQQSVQFGLQQQSGDQMVYIPQKPNNNLKNNTKQIADQQRYKNPYADQDFSQYNNKKVQLKSQGNESKNTNNNKQFNGQDSIAIQDIMSQKQMQQLKQQYDRQLGIQSKPDLASNIVQNRGTATNTGTGMSGKFGQMTFNNNNNNNNTPNSNNNNNNNNMKDSVDNKKGLNQAKQLAQQQLTKKTSQKATNNSPPASQFKPSAVAKKVRKAMDDQLIQQQPLNKKQQQYIQPTSTPNPNNMKNTAQPKKQNINQVPTSQYQANKNKQIANSKKQQKNNKNNNKNDEQVDTRKSTAFNIDQFMNQSDFQGLEWNPFKIDNYNNNNNNNKITNLQQYNQSYKYNIKQNKQQPQLLKFVKNKQKQQQQYKDSLVLSSSRAQRSKSPPKSNKYNTTSYYNNISSQSNKYNTYSQHNNNNDDRVDEQEQQILDQSKYEQSMPKGQKILMNKLSSPQQSQQIQKQPIQIYYKKSVQIGQQIQKNSSRQPSRPISSLSNPNNTNNNKQQHQQQMYQQMIKNPPKSYIRYDKPSSTHPNKLSNIRQQTQQNQSPPLQNQVQSGTQNITDIWQRVLIHIQNNQYNQAYSLTFQIDDPIYLLRLMLITQTPLKKLTPANITKLWDKFLLIYSHKFIDNIFVQMFTTANKFNGGRGLSKSLSIEETNDVLMELYQLSGRTKGKLSFGAATLYNQIQGAINRRAE